MAARHPNEGLLGWLLMAAALTGGALLCGFAAYVGRNVGAVDILAHIDHPLD